MLRTIQRVVLSASLFILFVLFPNPLWACSMFCPSLDQFKLALPNENLESSDAVFLGTLIEKAERVKDRPCRKKKAGPVLGPPNPLAGPGVQKKAMPATKNLSKCEEDHNSPNDENGHFSIISPSMNEHIYTFRVNKAWKGAKGKTVSLFKFIDMACGGMTCGTPNMVLEDYPKQFELGKRYLVYAYQSEEDKHLYPIWRTTRPAELAKVEMMFLDAAKKNASVASVVKQLPNIFRSRSSSATKAETIKWLRHAPPAISTENRRNFFIKALVRTDENLQKMRTPPARAKDFEGLPGYQEYFDEDDTTILTAIALALGNEEFKGDRGVIHVLRYLLNGAEPRVNIAAAESLKKLSLKDKETDKRIYVVLKYGLTHTDRVTRNLASTALTTIKTPESKIISLEHMKKNLPDDTSEKHKKYLDQLINVQKKTLANKNKSPKNP